MSTSSAGEAGAGNDERGGLDGRGEEEEEEEEGGGGGDPNEILDADSDSTLGEELAAGASAAGRTGHTGQRALKLVVEGNQLAKVLWFSCNAQLIPQAVPPPRHKCGDRNPELTEICLRF
eukprot:COSAG01_NODE_1458_length_10252_cov_247.726288_2_plen_120_part_00